MITLASIPSPSQNVIEIGPLTIHFYGILIAIGVIVAIIVSRHRYVRFGGSGETFERVAIWGVVIGFLGARLAYVSTHTHTFDNWYEIFFIWEGGLALYGGLVAGTVTFIYLLRKWNGDIFAVGDAVAIGVPLAQAIGRWGNYFNQELFGTPSTLPWAVEIDPAIAGQAGYPGFATFHPTFLYESLWNLLILIPLILVLERRSKLAKGASFGLYVAGYAVIRFLMELMRTDTSFRFLGLSRNGWVSIAFFLFGVGWIIYVQRRAENRTLIGQPTFFSPQPATTSTAASGIRSEESESDAGNDVASVDTSESVDSVDEELMEIDSDG